LKILLPTCFLRVQLVCLILFAICVIPIGLLAQKMDSKVGIHDTIAVPGIIIDGDTLAYFSLSPVNIRDKMLYRNDEEKMKYYRLRQDVITVLPYAKYAGIRYKWLQAMLEKETDNHKRKLLIRGVEEDIKKNYSKRLKDLTITQGRILIKLIDRETGQSSYQIVKGLKNGFSAFIFQGIAGFFGDNLKDKYNPVTDRDIEFIIQSTGYY
jgi:hypothetical protein